MTELETQTSGSGLAQVLAMSWPASLTMLNATVIKFVDGLMVSCVGPAPFSAQFVAGMFSFIPESFMLGLLTVVNTHVSQNFGAGNFRQTGRYAWAGIFLALGAAGVMAPLAIFAPEIFGMLRHGPAVLGLEVMYFRYMILTVCFPLSSRVLEQFFFGIHRPRIVLAASLVANTVNVIANYILIFGKFGFPAMGLKGAAIGTIIAWVAQFLILLGIFVSTRMHGGFATRFMATVRLRHCKDLVRVGWPAGMQLCNDILCWSLFTGVLVGTYFGAAHLTASVAAMRYLGLSFMPALGIGIATTALVGRYIGAGRPDLARRRAHTALLVAMVYMGLCGAAFYVFRYPMVRLFVRVYPSGTMTALEAQGLAEQIVQIGARILICAAVFQLFDAVGIVYVGALRGAGDTFWPMVITMVLSWTIIIGGGFAMVNLVPQLTSIGPWVAGSVYVIVLGSSMALRFESGAWRRIDLLGRLGRPALGDVPTAPGTDTTGVVPTGTPSPTKLIRRKDAT